MEPVKPINYTSGTDIYLSKSNNNNENKKKKKKKDDKKKQQFGDILDEYVKSDEEETIVNQTAYTKYKKY